MATAWKLGKVPIKDRLMTLEQPGKPLLFDSDKGLVDDITAKFDVAVLAKSLQGKDEKDVARTLEKLGQDVMKLTIELVDSKYLDRTGEMIEEVARQTGVSFPHRFERYIELSILGLRPMDKWNITKSTTREVVLQVSACAMHKALQEAGIQGLPCKAFCLASFDAAAEKTGDRIITEMKKTLPQDGMCQFAVSV
ncbi:MAG: hypothetical protein FJ008_02935 [Chloroflexi bacterium]|nr:hypothetical protein [Chloroflexota bacterium]MBM3173429.1 hypothetical protein [Chloroflexota bacterium]MBM3176026.1 hypothetical protein [Chloroflexota bacterium]MBM4449528.1 hypothetical protein [Chloroflexota bacterium]